MLHSTQPTVPGRPSSTAAGKPPHPALSPREQQVLQHIAQGHTYAGTARRIGISVHTVDVYVRRIKAKYDLSTQAELVRLALALDL
ncbi:helix-turn-helix transcriptional regulator [Streptomyces sp. NPDC005728]|uniref:response regulator transcription factor n=1 Tax=Streptomyces sp. NPDC005728 TaxID=3157054 RepID=UPI0033EF4904